MLTVYLIADGLSSFTIRAGERGDFCFWESPNKMSRRGDLLIKVENEEIAHHPLNGSRMIDRWQLLIAGGAFALAATPLTNSSAQTAPRETMQTNNTDVFWPDGARLVMSISMQMEAGAQPESGAESPLPKIHPEYPDIAATKRYEYGFKGGLPRLLDMFDRHKVKVTSHMVDAAVFHDAGTRAAAIAGVRESSRFALGTEVAEFEGVCR
jgi:hypothetical protein